MGTPLVIGVAEGWFKWVTYRPTNTGFSIGLGLEWLYVYKI